MCDRSCWRPPRPASIRGSGITISLSYRLHLLARHCPVTVFAGPLAPHTQRAGPRGPSAGSLDQWRAKHGFGWFRPDCPPEQGRTHQDRSQPSTRLAPAPRLSSDALLTFSFSCGDPGARRAKAGRKRVRQGSLRDIRGEEGHYGSLPDGCGALPFTPGRTRVHGKVRRKIVFNF